jgi:hypothetical protein
MERSWSATVSKRDGKEEGRPGKGRGMVRKRVRKREGQA